MVTRDQVSEVIRTVAETEILPRFRNLQQGQIREKSPNQLVTDADVMAERAFARLLPQLLPGAVVGEEGADADPASLDVLERESVVWIVDPVDGTGNFASGNPRFAVIIALLIEGHTKMGWIYDPMTMRMFSAEAGDGVWLDRTRLQVRSPVPLPQMVGSVKKCGRIRPFVAQISRLGSAAHDYLDLISGVTHFCHFGGKLMPWDHAAGVLFHNEAGGFNRMVNDTIYDPIHQHRLGGQILLTPDSQSWLDIVPFFR